MGYETWGYTMIAKQFYNEWEAVCWLLKGGNQELFDAINIQDEYDSYWVEDDGEQVWKEKNTETLSQINWNKFLEEADEEEADEDAFRKVFGFHHSSIVRKAGLSFEYEGDARFDVPHGWLGLSLDEMGDDETKNQFKARIKEIMERYSGESVDDLDVVSFSYTC